MADTARAEARQQFSIAGMLLPVLAAISFVYALVYAWGYWSFCTEPNAFLCSVQDPLGGDFINVWTAGRLALSGGISSVYSPEAFMAYQETFVGADIGLRMWANPPHSLLFVWPFSLGSYAAMYLAWSLFGIFILAYGAWRYGFDWKEIAILVIGPASLFCVTVGQTGNICCGLMLIALSGNRPASTAFAAALLTIKPQTGFLLPLLWLLQRRWAVIFITAVMFCFLVALSFGLFGVDAWRDYFGKTVPALSLLEREGSGSFMFKIPSLFMSLRLLGFDGSTALTAHFLFAAIVFAVLLWRLARTRNTHRQAALLLIATCLITPYLHSYDLGLLLAGAIIAMRTARGNPDRHALFALGVIVAWALPFFIQILAESGYPVSPLLILIVFALVAFIPADVQSVEHGR